MLQSFGDLSDVLNFYEQQVLWENHVLQMVAIIRFNDVAFEDPADGFKP